MSWIDSGGAAEQYRRRLALVEQRPGQPLQLLVECGELALVPVALHLECLQLLPQAIRLTRQLDQGDGVLVMTDVYGATPANMACKLLIPGKVEGVAGVNLPMLVRALTYRHEPLDVVVRKALSGGVEGVMQMPPASLSRAATGS